MTVNGGEKMNKEEFHSISGVSFVDRESFNNAILLLTMIKSDYYYIVGFSRPKQCITIAFDFESKYVPRLTEYLYLDFAESKESLVIKANVSNAAIGVDESFLKKVNNERFVLSGECASYTNYCRKDTVFPQSIEQINKFIRESINEIKKFLVEYYNFRLNNE